MSWLFLILIAIPAAYSAFKLRQSLVPFSESSYVSIIRTISDFKRRGPTGEYFRSGRKPLLGIFLAALSGAMLVVVPALASWVLINLPVSPWVTVLAAFIPCIIMARYVLRTALTLLAPEAISSVRNDPRPPILLLRSFDDDSATILPKHAWLRSLRQKLRLEEAAANELQAFGPFVAVGKPGEKLPQLGASRAYLSDDDWQNQVTDWMKISRFIVFVPGTTKWVAWEVQQALNLGFTGKLIFIFPKEPISRRRERLQFLQQISSELYWSNSFQDIDVTNLLCCHFLDDGKLNSISGNVGDQVEYEIAIMLAIYSSVQGNMREA